MALALRLPVLVGVTALLAVAAHAAAERSLPDPRLLALAAGAAALAALPLLRCERSFETIAAAVVAGQAGVHVVLARGHDLLPGLGAHPAAHAVPRGPLLLAHALAAGVAAWWLRRGESAAWNAARRVLRALAPARRAVLPVPAPRPRPAVRAERVLRHQVEDARAHPRRGPPARLAPAALPA